MSEAELYAVETRYDVRIPVRDGLQLSANLFMPVARTPGERFPAILEMIPYRKDDWRYCSDHQRMTYFAQRGYAGCRLDIRGTGSSPGIARDEYMPEETRDVSPETLGALWVEYRARADAEPRGPAWSLFFAMHPDPNYPELT